MPAGRYALMKVAVIQTRSLGNRSYVVIDDSEGARRPAAVIDPPRDIDRVEAALAQEGAELVLVAETHRHADYLSGGLELSRKHDVDYAVPPGDPEPSFGYLPAVEPTTLTVGQLTLRVMHTPGHTSHHVAYIVEHSSRALAVFSGGSLLHGAVGRTDLVGPDRA